MTDAPWKTGLRRGTLLGMSLLLLSACVTGARETGSARPAWIDSPGDGVSASAGMHVRGRAAQEELAILRAREEFAKRLGVSIRSVQTLSTTVAGGRASTVGSQIAQEETRQDEVKAVVRAKWLDPLSGVLWVWLVPDEH